VKKSDFESLRRGMFQAKAHVGGVRAAGFIVHEPVDVRGIRERTHLTRKEFAFRYRLDPRTVEQWEQGRRRPDRSTETYLRLIEREPEKMAEMSMALEA
jgi:putative transcriptional regulator